MTCIAAVAVQNFIGFIVLASVGTFGLLFAVGPLGVAVMCSVPPKLRNQAIAMQVLVYHLFGDFPSPLIIGAVADSLGFFWAMIICTAWLIWAVVLWGLALFVSRRDFTSLRKSLKQC